LVNKAVQLQISPKKKFGQVIFDQSLFYVFCFVPQRFGSLWQGFFLAFGWQQRAVELPENKVFKKIVLSFAENC